MRGAAACGAGSGHPTPAPGSTPQPERRSRSPARSLEGQGELKGERWCGAAGQRGAAPKLPLTSSNRSMERYGAPRSVTKPAKAMPSSTLVRKSSSVSPRCPRKAAWKRGERAVGRAPQVTVVPADAAARVTPLPQRRTGARAAAGSRRHLPHPTWTQGQGLHRNLPLCPALLRPPGSPASSSEPSARGRAGAVGAGPEEAPAMMRGLEPLCWEERLGELGLLSLGRRRLREELTAAVQNVKRACKKAGDRLFSRACSDRTRGDGFKLKEGRL